ncbi:MULTISPECIES: 4'-phosphopantetheinyl transferase family protein [unclassified Peribacillus]|uniref:4'-phosphopantetheinyl transferase family protein n=1 Tax=unclassified Peribacillus TaxID=2675266 RepID=UPI001F4E1DF4|nr:MULTISPECIES: 4'-phosphopantetheinyl transferase superfamily protein [unclassified Peribacillus]MCK1985463.1 4'-phosphopantetheinyl transferase superfamily protein [Peribacillus sp. Aquil_B1]MCK2007803.1 4'-phosphopantetheinyl transferase superfamily protein [Peribacillus sp. Aquil_B8]
MNSIHKTDFHSLWDTCLSENRARYINSSSQYRKQTIFAGDILLRYALLSEKLDISKVKIGYGKNGKPYIKNGGIHFNLSHSKNLVVLGIGKQELGIDILCERKINKELIKYFFSEEEQRYLHHLKEGKQDYYWNALCYKEAYIKCSGGKIINMKNRLVCPKDLQYGKVNRVKQEREQIESIFFKASNYHICMISNNISRKLNIEILDMDIIHRKIEGLIS